jgi:hypothetical protein
MCKSALCGEERAREALKCAKKMVAFYLLNVACVAWTMWLFGCVCQIVRGRLDGGGWGERGPLMLFYFF